MSTTNALRKRLPVMVRSPSEYSRNNNVMVAIVESALHKLYEGKHETNPLLKYEHNILNYFKQHNMDLVTFHTMDKSTFIAALKHHIFGSLEPQENTEEALGLLFGYIDFVDKVPRRTPTPPTSSQSTRGLFRPLHMNRANPMHPKQHPPSTHSLPQNTLEAIKIGITESLRPSSIKTKDARANPHASLQRPPIMRKHKTAVEDDEDEKDEPSIIATLSLRVDITACNDHKLSFEPRGNRRVSSEVKTCTHAVYPDASLFVGKKRHYNYQDITVKLRQMPQEMIEINHNQFLYIAGRVMDQMNHEIKQSRDDAKLLYNKSLILGYLRYCKRLDGMSFRRSHDSFVHNIKSIVFDTTNKNDFITERVKEQYTNELYQRIDSFDLRRCISRDESAHVVSFHPSSTWLTEAYHDDRLRNSSFGILSTLNQYQHSSYLTKPVENRQVVHALDECNRKISSILSDKWTVCIKNQEKTWNHTIGSVRECTVLNMLYLLDCILNNKVENKIHFRLLQQHTSKILRFFEEHGIDGDLFTTIHNDFIHTLNNYIDPLHAIGDNINALFRFISKLNVFKITAFHIKMDIKWDVSIQAIKQCKEKDILYIVIHFILSDPSLKTLLPFQHKIVEYFIRNEMNGRRFEDIKEQIFVDRLDKCIKFKHKAPLIKLYYAIKRFQIQDMAHIAVEQHGQSSAHLNKRGFMRWDRRTNFKHIKRVGYDCEDGVIAIADILSHSKEGNKNKIQVAVKNIGTESNSYLAEPFWISLPNHKLCKPTKEVIQQSHYDVFHKWIMILGIKSKQRSSFEDNVFRDMASVAQRHPQLIFTIRHANYAVKLEDKKYDDVLHSFFAYSLVNKCKRPRCRGSPKLNCYCDSDGYQAYTYHMMIVILSAQRHHDRKILEMLKSHSHNTIEAAEKLCEFYRQKYRGGSYIDRHKKHIQRWLLHDFYNIICSHCGSVNKSIMINRVFHYSATLRNCRTCGVICIGATTEYDRDDGNHGIVANHKPRTKSAIYYFCRGSRKRVFNEERINVRSLESALKECRFRKDISSQHKESELLNLLLSLLNERFDELTYYLSRFLDDVDDWKALRIKITTDFYFYKYPKPFVSVTQFMKDAGIHLRHINIFKDCWTRALFQSVKDNQPLIDILNHIDRSNAHHSQSHAKKDVLCTDLERLQIFRKLTPSISAFTTQFIQKLKQNPSSNRSVDLFSLIQSFLDFKIDHNVFSVIHELELVSLIWNRWEYLTPSMLTSVSYSNWSNYFGIVIECTHDSLRNELINELGNIINVDAVYSDLERKAETLWKSKKKKLTANRSKWNEIVGVSSGTRITVQYIHAVLLFAEIPELRYKIRTLLAGTPLIAVHQRFGHLFKLLKEVIYLYGERIELQSMFYCLDERIVLDKYRGMLNVPVIGSDRPSAFHQPHNPLMAECEASTAFECFNLAALIEDPSSTTQEQDFYLFFGGPHEVRQDIHLDRQRLRKGSKCDIYSNSQHKFVSGKVHRVYTDRKGEWLKVAYSVGGVTKDIKRMSHQLSVIVYDEWHDIMKHFGGDTGAYRDRDHEAFNHPLFTRLMAAGRSILKEHEIQCTPELTFRIKTVLTYYKTSQNVIPDFDTFIQETNINVSDDKLDGFREAYQKEKELAQRQRLQSVRRSISLKALPLRSSLMDILSSAKKKNALKLEDPELGAYDLGIFMRYEVNNPRFESLAEETMFNEVANISNERFNQHLTKAKEIHCQHCFMMLSKASDFHFGIEHYEPISMAHIIAVIIHTEEPKYSRDFTRSCLLLNRTDSEMVIQNHCNNFYWFGRYLFECIEYFGETMTEQSSTQQKQGLPRTFKFDLFAPLINFPRSTTKSLDMAYHYAEDTGCVLQLIPKYYGVLNSTKFINLFTISEDYDNDTRLFFGRRCAIQIINIWLSDCTPLQEFILPLVYLEKLLLQTIFDRQFYNAKHLYDKDGDSSNIQNRLFNLIRSCTTMTLYRQQNSHTLTTLDQETQLMIITQYFPDIAMEQHAQIRYAVELLKHWCLKRTFVTFESFAAELPFMIPPLRHYFVWRDDKNEPYHIHIDRLQVIMPNLEYYRNFKKHVVAVEPLPKEEHVVKVVSNSIIDTIDDNLVHYYLAQDNLTYRHNFRTWCDERRYDDSMVEERLKRLDDCEAEMLAFDKEFPRLSDYANQDERSAYVFGILKKATKPKLLTLLSELEYYVQDAEMDEKQFDDLNPRRKSTLPSLRLSRNKSMFGISGTERHKYEEYDAIYRVLSNCQRHEIPDQICDILEKKLGFWDTKATRKMSSATMYHHNKQIKKDIATWKGRNRHKLEEFYVPISKLQRASRKDFIKVAEKIKLFDENMMEKLCDKLMERLFTDIERMKAWKCNVCWFMNRKMMIGGLWCLYNQLNECGLCGAERYKFKRSRKSSAAIPRKHKPSQPHHEPPANILRLPTELNAKWVAIEDTPHGQCAHADKLKALNVYLEGFTVTDMIQFIEGWLQDNHRKLKKLQVHKNSITHYFEQREMDGTSYLNKKTKEITKEVVASLGDKKLTGQFKKLHPELTKYVKGTTIDCKPMRRIAVVLSHYHTLTEQLKSVTDRYSCSIRQFLCAFDSENSRVQLLDDFEHILDHKPSIRAQQPYIPPCTKGKRCIHQNRMKHCQQTQVKLSQQQKQKLFNCDDWKDYEYILFLDKMHCALFHYNDRSLILNKEKHIIRRYSNFAVYSTGIYIDHSSLSPLHVNLKEELNNNSVYSVEENHWESALEKAKVILGKKSKEDRKWRAKETNEIYGIRVGDFIQIEHILVVFLYTSNSALCRLFRESYRSSEYDDNNQNIRSYHINNFYWMGRFIYTAIQFFGQKPKSDDRFYHGLRKPFLFTEFSTIFEPPTSTTKDEHIAFSNFAGDGGIVLTLGPKFKNELNNSKYLDVSAISNYRKEQERLFAGMTVLAVIDIQYQNGREICKLGKHAKVFLYFERIVEQTIHNKSYYNYEAVSRKEQERYLLPLIKHQMQRNRIYDDDEDEKVNGKEEYLYALFEHFCDSKQEYINLTCINDEIVEMHESIKRILFKENKGNVYNKWEINDENLQLIFPKLKGYKNYLGYWIHFEL